MRQQTLLLFFFDFFLTKSNHICPNAAAFCPFSFFFNNARFLGQRAKPTTVDASKRNQTNRLTAHSFLLFSSYKKEKSKTSLFLLNPNPFSALQISQSWTPILSSPMSLELLKIPFSGYSLFLSLLFLLNWLFMHACMAWYQVLWSFECVWWSTALIKTITFWFLKYCLYSQV